MLRNKGTNNTLPEKKEVLLNREYIPCCVILVWLSSRSSSVVLSMKKFSVSIRARTQEITVVKIAPFVHSCVVFDRSQMSE